MTLPNDPQRWQRLSRLFDALIDLDLPARATLLDAECAGDPQMRAEIERMLAFDASPHSFDHGVAGAVDLHDNDGRLRDKEISDSIGERLGAWRIDGLLGRGGMGTVYAAQRDDGDTLQRAALKRLQRRWDGSLQAQRFLQERRILAALSHPHIPRLLDHGLDHDGRPWFALEFVDGQTLIDWADAHRLALPARIDLFRAVCAAVQHAHEHFIVHRDLKPANILVDGGGYPKVLDFGVAKRMDDDPGATRNNAFAGFTPEYAAPEQVSGGAISAATDVYALGVILYQLLAGRLPYAIEPDDLRATADAITTRSAERLDQAITTGTRHEVDQRMRQRDTDLRAFRRFVRGDLSRIVQTALAKEPPRRYASVQALSDDLKRFLEGHTVSVGGDTFGYRASKFVLRNRWGVAMAGLASVALVAGISGVLMQSNEARMQAERANLQAARAEKEATRAKLEVERMEASNEFMHSIFSGASFNNSGTPNISLRDALDLTVRGLDSGETRVVDPQVRLRFLLAASTSYEALGEVGKAEEMARRALQTQQASLPDSKEDRARALSNLAWLRMTYEPKQSLAWAKEAMALHRANDPVSHAGLSDTYSVLAATQYLADDFAGALETTRQGRRFMLDNGVPEADKDVISTYSSEAVILAALSRFDEAAKIHENVIRLRAQSVGAESVATLNERAYYGVTLNRAERFAEALAQFQLAQPGMLRELGKDHDNTQYVNYGLGRALVGLGRYADALPALAAAHAHGRSHGFQDRQGTVGFFYVASLAHLKRCTEARAIVDELNRRKIDFLRKGKHPFEGTPCAP